MNEITVPDIQTVRAKLEELQALLSKPVIGLPEGDREEAVFYLETVHRWVHPPKNPEPIP